MSAIFFKFKSQKEPQRVTFDGTHLSVFETKREIIRISQLGDGTDFDLAIYHEDSNEEYDDDTAIVPRSTTVIARRLPASKPGQGRAARYVSGRMATTAKNSRRVESNTTSSTNKQGTAIANGASAMEKAQTEEERIAAILQMGGDQWEEQKQHMASAAPVYRPGGPKGKPVNLPDHPPPPEYVCYRCGVKGHWIQACPTNNDPKFDGRPRVVRTVGIPRSFLTKVEKPTASANDGLTDETLQPSSRWVDSSGNAVAAVPDSASWEQYQAKAQASAAREDIAAGGSKELQDLGLECPVDKRLFVDPMKTPCCGKTYCHDCIETALINSDLVCPGCSTDGVLLDNLVTDEDMVAKIKAYEEEKKAERTEKRPTEKVDSPEPSISGDKTDERRSPTPAIVIDGVVNDSPKSPSSENKKKRAANEELQNDRKPNAPTPMQKTKSNNTAALQQLPNAFDQAFINQMNALASPQQMSNGQMNPNNSKVQPTGMDMFPMGLNPMGMAMNMDPMMAMQPQMMNPMMMPQWSNLPMGGMGMNMNMNMGMGMAPGMGMGMGFPQWNPNLQNPMQQQDWQSMPNGWGNTAPSNNMMPMYPGMQQQTPTNPTNNFNNHQHPQRPQQQQPQHQQQKQPQKPMMAGVAGTAKQPPTGPAFMNQQHSRPGGVDEDQAYMRQPVNPHRHLGRGRKVRPMDYREL